MAYNSKFTGAQIDALLDASSAMRTSKEDAANKVTSLDNPSDVTYPTSKAVKEYVNAELADKEDAANKVANFDNPNDSTFPTTKAVWDMVSNQFWYGVEWDKTISSPTCTRIGNLEFHRTLPVQSQMRGCLLADGGTVNKYLNPDDWTGEVRDGSQGMVMVELPRYYRKFEEDGNKIRLKLSLLPLDGFHEVPKKYVSAYEAAMERSTGKLCSVVNESTDYRGGYNDSSWDGTYRSQLGMPATNINRTNFRAAARKRGSNSWNILTYDVYKDLYWLYVCEYATLNSQAAYNAELTSEGYHQGGMGTGITNINGTNWGTFNSYRPLAKCGLSDYAGNNTTQHSLHLENDDASIVFDAVMPRYRGIENPFGHLWKICDGVNVIISPTAENGGDDTSKVYVCDNPDKFNDSNVDYYRYAGLEARNESFVKQMAIGEFGDIVPVICGGASSSTYYCDYHYTNIPTSQTLRMWLLGGYALNGSGAGFACVGSYDAPSSAYSHFGSRLCFLPR